MQITFGDDAVGVEGCVDCMGGRGGRGREEGGGGGGGGGVGTIKSDTFSDGTDTLFVGR